MERESESRKIVLTLALASFLNDFGSDMIYPIWPLFVTQVLRANMAILGLLDGLGDAIVSISQAISGWLSDKLRKRKVFVWLGYLLASFSRIGYAFSKAWYHLIPFKILDRFGKIRGSPRDAMIADVSTRKNRGRNFGFLRAMDNLGAVFGVLACIFLFPILGYRNLFLLASLPSLVGVILILILIKERKVRKIFKKFSFKFISSNFKLFLLSTALFSLSFFSYSFLLVFARDFGFEHTFLPVLYLTFTLVASLSSLPFGKLADKTSRKFVLIISIVFFQLMCLGFILADSLLFLYFLFIIYGLHLGARVPVQKAFVSELVPVRYRASALGIFQLVAGLCLLPSSLIAGILWTIYGKITPFIFSLILSSLSLVILLLVKEERSPHELKG